MQHYVFLLGLLLVTASGFAQGRCQRGNCYTGEGVLRFADGALYAGTFRKGRFEGQGTLTYPDGSVYRGGFRLQLQHGEGSLVDAKGNRYEGNWANGKRNGHGAVTYLDGSRISGEWVDDHLNGEVSFLFANRDYYHGQMRQDRMSGYGVMQYANGDEYRGHWENNKQHGTGSLHLANGTELTGSWTLGNFTTDWDALGFTGSTVDLVDCNEGCPDGNGLLRYPDGTLYRGQLIDGVPQGRGTLTYPDGSSYRGLITDHQPQGLGIKQLADGSQHGGVWEQGELYRTLYTGQTEPAPAALQANYDEEVKVWAVVVGCAFYQHMKTLRYTDDDAYQVYAFLKSVEGGALDDDQVKVLIDEDATHDNILAAMRDTYRQADENDVILFYFSGHGLPGSFLPVDYDGQFNALRHEDVHDVLLSSRSRHKLVIADACHSGSLAARSGGGSAETLSNYYNALTNAQASTALMMSSKGEEISMEDGGLRSGVFSHYLIRGLKGEADANGDRLVTIQELFSFVHREVRGYTGNIQTPTLTGTYDELMPISAVRDLRRRP